jgi:transcriptional regulator with XRE-family HTH domain
MKIGSTPGEGFYYSKGLKEIAQNLKDEIARRQQSGNQVAEDIGIAPATLKRILDNSIISSQRPPEPESLWAIAPIIGLTQWGVIHKACGYPGGFPGEGKFQLKDMEAAIASIDDPSTLEQLRGNINSVLDNRLETLRSVKLGPIGLFLRAQVLSNVSREVFCASCGFNSQTLTEIMGGDGPINDKVLDQLGQGIALHAPQFPKEVAISLLSSIEPSRFKSAK